MLRSRIFQQTVARTLRPAPWQMDNLTDIGSRQIFTEEHDTIREQFRKFWRSIDKERTQKWTDQGFVDKDFWKEVGAQGMIGIETPLEKGGWGGDFIQHVIATEEQAYARVPGNFLLQSDMVLPYVAHNGSDAQVNRYAQAMRDGECIGAIAMTEAHAGSDLQGMKSWARRDGDDWILNGSKGKTVQLVHRPGKLKLSHLVMAKFREKI